MFKAFKALALGAAVAAAPLSASAATTFIGQGVTDPVNVQVDVDTNSNEYGNSTVGFTFGNTPFSAFARIVVGNTFNLSFDYDVNDRSAQSGFVLINLSAPARLTTTGPFCTEPAVALAAIRGNCDLITGTGTDPRATQDSEFLFEGLAAGDYRIGIVESGTPTTGNVTFTIAEVPLPASLALLLSALGGVAFLRRRRTAEAAAA